VFDTGITVADTSTFGSDQIVYTHDWTNEATPDDCWWRACTPPFCMLAVVGHGTYVASVIGGRHPHCSGVAPGARIHVYKVFTSKHISYTSWMLDAFNHALQAGEHITANGRAYTRGRHSPDQFVDRRTRFH
jgi:subtilisin family serine protease